MRNLRLITVFSLLILTACDYNVPLVAEVSLPIDQALLGTWEAIPEDRDPRESLDRMVIRQQSANLYEIEFGDEGSRIYFKGWLAELEGIRFMQVEFTGDEEGPIDAKYKQLFSVLSFTLGNGELVVRSLNTDLVNQDLVNTAALQVAFAANRDNPLLFHEPGQFRRLGEKSVDVLRTRK